MYRTATKMKVVVNVVVLLQLIAHFQSANGFDVECKEAYSCVNRSWSSTVTLAAYGYKSMRQCFCDGCALIVAGGASSSEYGRKLTTTGLIQCLGAYSVCLCIIYVSRYINVVNT